MRARCLREARRLLSGPDAEDAAQEAALRAWAKRKHCRNQAAAGAWVAAIARNEALRVLGGSRPLAGSAEDYAERAAAGDPTGDSIVQLDLQLALRGLSTQDKVLARMRFIEDLSDAQIAEILRVPIGTAKVKLHRLRAKLREPLNEYASEDH